LSAAPQSPSTAPCSSLGSLIAYAGIFRPTEEVAAIEALREEGVNRRRLMYSRCLSRWSSRPSSLAWCRALARACACLWPRLRHPGPQ
jgi:hypothetical protein